MIFNIVVDVVVRVLLKVVCGPQEAQHGMSWAAVNQNLVFFGDGGRIVGRDHILVQDALIVSVVML